MKILLVSGSSRANSQSLKVTKWLESQLQKLGADSEIIDLQSVNLPLVHEDIWDDIANLPVAKNIKKILESADGFVIVTPEWNGMAAPALKNLFSYLDYEVANKPAYLVAVSANRGGAYPIAEMRMNSAKNSFISYIPEHLIVRGVKDVMNDTEIDSGEGDDQYIKRRAIYGLKILLEYTKALGMVRESGVLDYEIYANGM